MGDASEMGWQPLKPPSRTTRSSLPSGLSRPSGVSRSSAADPSTQSFGRLALAHALSTAGDAMVTVALAGSLFFSIPATAARGKVALSLLFTVLPFAVVAPLLGPAIDRTRGGRRLMMTASAAGRVVAALLMAREIHSLWLFPAALALLILSKTHAVAKSALVPGAVRSSDYLVEANGKLALLAAVVALVAALPAVGILKLLDGAWVLRTAAVIYAGGIVASLRLRAAPSVELKGAPEPVRAVALHRGVFLAATAMAVLRGVVGFLTFAVAFDFRRHHASSGWFALVLGASTLGNVAGTIVGPHLRTAMKEERILAGSLAFVACVAVFAGWLGSRIGMTLLALAVGVCAATSRLAFDAIVQRDAPEEVRARTFARFEARFQVVWVGAALIPVVVAIPNRAASFVLALATGFAAVAYITGRRKISRDAAAVSHPTSGPGGVHWADDPPPAS